MILLIDNYDSFSYNLYQMVGEINSDIKVVRNDKITCEEIEKILPEKIILSPGPGRPENAGIILHQAICQAFGAKIIYAKKLMHGKQSEIFCEDKNLFAGCGKNFLVGRYHSLAVEEKSLPKFLKITAKTADDEIMAVEHEKFKTFGVQFHPESILTPQGKIILKNFLEM